jgi:drug/metabolite transporter (DMT)-like permease
MILPLLRRQGADILLLGVALVWGSSYLATKVLTVHASVFAILASRFLIASVIMLVVWGIRQRKQADGPLGRRGILVAITVGCTQAVILSLETWGVSLTSATNAGLIISMTIVFTPVLESVWLRHWLPRKYFVAATVAVVGVALLVSGTGLETPSLGDLLMLAAAVVRAVHVTALGRLTAGHHYGSVSITLIQTLVCTALFIALDVPGLGAITTSFSGSDWIIVFYLAFACTVFAFLVQLWAVRRTSASRVSLLLGTEPIWAVVIGVSLGGEALGWIGVAGAALIIAGSYRAQAIETRFRREGVLTQRKKPRRLAPSSAGPRLARANDRRRPL